MKRVGLVGAEVHGPRSSKKKSIGVPRFPRSPQGRGKVFENIGASASSHIGECFCPSSHDRAARKQIHATFQWIGNIGSKPYRSAPVSILAGR